MGAPVMAGKGTRRLSLGPSMGDGARQRKGSRAYSAQASGWRALALAALYPLRVLAQPTHRLPEEGRR